MGSAHDSVDLLRTASTQRHLTSIKHGAHRVTTASMTPKRPPQHTLPMTPLMVKVCVCVCVCVCVYVCVRACPRLCERKDVCQTIVHAFTGCAS